jgi:hypothetical protein
MVILKVKLQFGKVHQETCGQDLVYKYVYFLEKMSFIDMRNQTC